jgi:putative membrane protein
MSVVFRRIASGYSVRNLLSSRAALIIIIVVHFFGAIGLLIPDTRPYFEIATPLNLIITSLILFGFHKDWNLPFLLFAIITFLVGYLIEVIGVHTAAVFGSYQYGDTLGLKLWDVPLIIGVNWLMLIYVTGNIANSLSGNIMVKCLLGSLLMVGLDYFIEPVAVALDFWSWAGGKIPLQNFVGWLITAFVLQFLYHTTKFDKTNIFAKYVFAVQLVFFIFLQTFV